MKNFKFICLLIIFNACPGFIYPQIKGFYKEGEKKFTIDTVRGMYNGNCTLWFKNGSKKYEGHYKNNQKYGVWTAWDSLGRVRVKCRYKNNTAFRFLAFNNSEGKPMRRLTDKEFIAQRYKDSIAKRENKLFWTNVSAPAFKDSLRLIEEARKKPKHNKPRETYGYEEYIEKRDSLGLIKYHYVSDNDVFTSVKMYRFLEPGSTNNPLFKDNALQKIISSYLENTVSPEIYTNSQFVNKVTAADALSKLKDVKAVLAYKVMELWYFDKKRFSSATRILGLCPVLYDKATQTYRDLFWIYYTAIRENLAGVKVTVKDNSGIQTPEDLFYLRYFSGFVYYREDVEVKEEEVNIYKNHDVLIKGSAVYEGIALQLEYLTWWHFTL